jgi:ABC-type Fe3+-hydroxamate transport system substrate-binding protein
MPLFTDQTGRDISLPSRPTRIVSLVPSQTELLYHLGLEEEVMGITSFCVHPPHWYRNKTRIGGTKQVHTSRIKALQPDLIIANKEENTKEQVDELLSDYPVWISDISNLQAALQMINALGEITGTAAKAQTLASEIKMRFSQLAHEHSAVKTAYLIWQHPCMTVGGDTFINDMLARGGFENIFKDQQRYPVVSIEEIRNRNCELLMLSSEPFPFKQTHMEALQEQLPSTRILLADGEMFSWYGSRLLLAPDYFRLLMRDFERW